MRRRVGYVRFVGFRRVGLVRLVSVVGALDGDVKGAGEGSSRAGGS